MEDFLWLTHHTSPIPSPNSKSLSVGPWMDSLQVSLWEPSLPKVSSLQPSPFMECACLLWMLVSFILYKINKTAYIFLLNLCFSILCSVYIPMYLSFYYWFYLDCFQLFSFWLLMILSIFLYVYVLFVFFLSSVCSILHPFFCWLVGWLVDYTFWSLILMNYLYFKYFLPFIVCILPPLWYLLMNRNY